VVLDQPAALENTATLKTSVSTTITSVLQTRIALADIIATMDYAQSSHPQLPIAQVRGLLPAQRRKPLPAQRRKPRRAQQRQARPAPLPRHHANPPRRRQPPARLPSAVLRLLPFVQLHLPLLLPLLLLLLLLPLLRLSLLTLLLRLLLLHRQLRRLVKLRLPLFSQLLPEEIWLLLLPLD
jgi:hypothetical protein